MRLDYDAGRFDASVGAAEGGDDAVAATFGGAEVDEDDLILIVVDDATEFDTEFDEIRGGELALEDGVLEVVAEAAHDFEDLTEAFVVRDVVGDEVGGAHCLGEGGTMQACGFEWVWFG